MVRVQDVLKSNPKRIFADLVPCSSGTTVLDGDVLLTEIVKSFPKVVTDAIPVQDGDSRFIGILTCESVQEAILEAQKRSIKKLEHQQEEFAELLRQKQKIESLGQLVAGVAHDFSNFAMIISGNAQLMLHSTDISTECRQRVDDILAAVKKTSALTQQLLAFSRNESLEQKRLDLNLLLAQSIRLMRQALPDNIRLCFQVAPEPAIVHADEMMMEQILINLVVNARDALPEGGLISITVQHNELTAINENSRAGDYVVLSVSDTGIGIPPEVITKIYDPFFTTKEKDHGTGLGLSTVKSIVEQHSGSIQVESKIGKGTTFKLCLPASH